MQALTAHFLATSVGKLSSSKSCLVHACAGGTGSILCQIARILGAKVIGTCSTNKLERGRLFADHVIDYTKISDISTEVLKITEDKGVDVVFDGVGLDTYLSSFKSVKQRGLVCFFGNASGAVPPINPLDLAANGSIFITRPTLGHFISNPEELTLRCNDVISWIQNKNLEFTIDKIYNIEQAGEALEYMENGRSVGKVLLRI